MQLGIKTQRVCATLAAAFAAGGLAALVTSSSNLIWLASHDMPVGFGTVLEVFAKDATRLGTVLAILTLISFTLAFPIASWVSRKFTPQLDKRAVYAIAGGAGILTMLYLLIVGTLQVELISGYRSPLGVVLHGLAGAVGGYVFALCMQEERSRNFAFATLGALVLIVLLWQL